MEPEQENGLCINVDDDKSSISDKTIQKILKSNRSSGSPRLIIELKLRKLKILISPEMPFFPKCSLKMPFIVYISRNATVGELQLKIILALK